MTPERRAVADRTKGFLPTEEAEALHRAALEAVSGPFLEVGSYCGKSAIWLGAAAQARDTVLYTVDHHRGSEEIQPGWEYHDPEVVDPTTGRMDTLPFLRRAIEDADLEDFVIAVVGRSATVGAWWSTPLGFLFIDGGHSDEVVRADEAAWLPHVQPGGTLAIHDVHPDPKTGGQAPFGLYRRCLDSAAWSEISATGSLRVLMKS